MLGISDKSRGCDKNINDYQSLIINIYIYERERERERERPILVEVTQSNYEEDGLAGVV